MADFFERIITSICGILSGICDFLSQFSLLRDALSLIVGIGILWAFGVMLWSGMCTDRDKVNRFWDRLESRKK